MIKSRLKQRRPRVKNVTVKDIAGTVVLADLEPTHQQVRNPESAGPLAEMSTRILDVFFFPKVDGSFPAILEKHILTWDSVDYEVTSVQALGQLLDRLRVETERVR